MKSLLEGLDLSAPGGILEAPIYKTRTQTEFVDLDDYNELKAVAEAALAVIDANEKMTASDEVTNGKIRFCLEKRAELETALAPFRKEQTYETNCP